MNAVDTNVFVYYFDPTEPTKQAKAAALLKNLASATTSSILLWQVIAEFVGQMRYWHSKGQITWAEVVAHINEVRGLFALELPSSNVIDSALTLSNRYSLSHGIA